MEWVETTGETIEEAKSRALDQLGVAEDDAEFEVLDEPKPGLFGRMRGEARVRARVRPTSPRRKQERRDGNRAKRGSAPAAPAARAPRTTERRQRDDDEPRRRADGPPVDPATVSGAATTFLEGLVTAAGIAGTVEARIEGEEIDLNVTGDGVELFVGPKGSTLSAVQDLARVVSQRKLGDHDTHLRVDIGSYRVKRRDALSKFARRVAADVIASGQPRVLEPMNSADRKVVHDTLLDVEGVVTRSQGQDPHRRVVVALDDAE